MINLSDLRPLSEEEEDLVLATLARWLAGTYDNFAQSDDDPGGGVEKPRRRLLLHIMPMSIAGLSDYGNAFYVKAESEQGRPGRTKPYRQRVYLVGRSTAGQLIGRMFFLKPSVVPVKDKNFFADASYYPERLEYLTADCLKPAAHSDVIWQAQSDPENFTSSGDFVIISILLFAVLGVGLRFGLAAAAIDAMLTWAFFSIFVLARIKSPEMRFRFAAAGQSGYLEERKLVIGSGANASHVFWKR